MRVHSTVKINRLRNPRLPYPIREAEVHENAYKYMTADGIAIEDGEGILYWIDTIVTTDAGGVRVYDNTAASGNTLAGAYAAKAVDGVLKSWDPPKRYLHGVYVNLTNAIVEICYKPIARNLKCKLNVLYGPGTADLLCKVNVYFTAVTRDLVLRVTVRGKATRALISTVDVLFAPATLDLVSRVTVYKEASKALVCKLYADRTP